MTGKGVTAAKMPTKIIKREDIIPSNTKKVASPKAAGSGGAYGVGSSDSQGSNNAYGIN